MRTEFHISDALSVGRDKAIVGHKLMDIYGLTDRELRASVERDRRAGIPIISKKGTGGGYWLAETEEEVKHFITFKLSEFETSIETMKSMAGGKFKPLSNLERRKLKGLIS